jgi:hypothetical protein
MRIQKVIAFLLTLSPLWKKVHKLLMQGNIALLLRTLGSLSTCTYKMVVGHLVPKWIDFIGGVFSYVEGKMLIFSVA